MKTDLLFIKVDNYCQILYNSIRQKLSDLRRFNKMRDFTHIDIENEKVKCIVIAAIEVFSNNDYEKASTNMIVKKADIPRGVLYYYFKNKEELFEFLIYYSQKIFIRDYEKSIDWNEGDYLNRIKDIILIKTQIMSEYPFLAEFAEKVQRDHTPNDYASYADENNAIRKRIMEDNIDYSTLRENVDVVMFKKLAYFSISGEINSILKVSGYGALSTEKDRIIEVVDEQIDFLKKHFYR
jgi:TetR/AcrR family transcriptional regulator